VRFRARFELYAPRKTRAGSYDEIAGCGSQVDKTIRPLGKVPEHDIVEVDETHAKKVGERPETDEPHRYASIYNRA
jgi:hypothetical protein